MINLLPPDAKKQLAASRANRLLLRYLLLFIMLAVIMVVVIGFAYLYLDNMKHSYQRTIDENTANAHHMGDSQQQVAEFRANLSAAKQILDKQVNYSRMALRIANVMPRGVVLDDLTLDKTTVGAPSKLNARVANKRAAQQLKDALDASPRYFSGAHYDTITRAEDDAQYPFAVVMTVTIKPEILDE